MLNFIVLELRVSLDQIIHTFSSTSCGRSLAPVSFKTFLLPFRGFCSLRRLWARDAVCSLAAMHDVRCRERPWLCLNVLLHPLQVKIMMIRSTITFMVIFPLVEERGRLKKKLYSRRELRTPRESWLTQQHLFPSYHYSFINKLTFLRCHPTVKTLRQMRAAESEKVDSLIAWNYALGSVKGALEFWMCKSE